MDVLAHNRTTWDAQVERGNRWTIPVSPAVVDAARQGQWEIVLTPNKPVPRHWFTYDQHEQNTNAPAVEWTQCR